MLRRSLPGSQNEAFVMKLHQRETTLDALVNAGVAVAKGFRAYDEGSKDGIWIKDHAGSDYVGQVRRVHDQRITYFRSGGCVVKN